jgi:hypothetical protein
MGKHIIGGPLVGIGGSMQLIRRQTGCKFGDTPRRFRKQGQNLLNGE